VVVRLTVADSLSRRPVALVAAAYNSCPRVSVASKAAYCETIGAFVCLLIAAVLQKPPRNDHCAADLDHRIQSEADQRDRAS
jgi:hypothetical protein